MPKKRVKDLVPADDLPLAKEAQRFITFYLSCRDLKEAACKCGLDPAMGEKLFQVPRVRNAIQRRINLVEMESAKLRAKADLLTVDLLDASLCDEVKSKRNGHIRIRAIELGYKRTGLIRDGEFVGIQQKGGGVGTARTYGQVQTTTMTRTTTEQLVQETAVQVPVMQARLMQVEAEAY